MFNLISRFVCISALEGLDRKRELVKHLVVPFFRQSRDTLCQFVMRHLVLQNVFVFLLHYFLQLHHFACKLFMSVILLAIFVFEPEQLIIMLAFIRLLLQQQH